MKINLRPYQDKLVNEIRAAYADGCMSPLCVLPTGGGKTFIFSVIALLTKARGFSSLILTHREELWTQASDSLDRLDVEHGIIAPNFTYSGDLVNVASVQTLVRRLDKIKAPDLIIIDEAHHCVSGNTWGKVLAHFPKARVLGVTATPIRLDGSGLGKINGGFFDCMIQGPSMLELQEMGFLCQYRYFAPPVGASLENITVTMGDYNKEALALAMDKPQITGCAVAHYAKICPGLPAIAFCVNVAHAEHTAEQFRAKGFKAKSIDGKMDKATRKSLIKALGDGRLDVLTSCDIISEGTDIPIVTVGILLRPTKSLGMNLQRCGRVLRPAPNKPFAIILDHVESWKEHGFPNFEHEWNLNAEKIKRKKAKPNEEKPLDYRICDKCYTPSSRALSACLNCGFIFVVKESSLKQVEGELVEILDPKALAFKAKRREQGKARDLVSLIKLARQKGYKDSWAMNIYKSRGNNVSEIEFEKAKIEARLR